MGEVGPIRNIPSSQVIRVSQAKQSKSKGMSKILPSGKLLTSKKEVLKKLQTGVEGRKDPNLLKSVIGHEVSSPISAKVIISLFNHLNKRRTE